MLSSSRLKAFACTTLITVATLTAGAVAVSDGIGQSCRGPCPCNGLGTVHCAGLGLDQLPADIGRDIVYLNFQENSLIELGKDSLAGFSRLQRLTLSVNRIKTVASSALRHLKRLVSLDLSSNHLQSLSPRVFGPLRRLEHLSLAYNSLRDVDGLLDGLKHLQTVNLRGNAIESITEVTFAGNANLRYLDLSNNRLTSLPGGMLAGQKLLAYLILSDNRLGAAMPNLTVSSPLLVHLAMRNCGLAIIPPWIPPTLVDLNLATNLIKRVDRNQLALLNRLTSFDLGYNVIDHIDDGTFDGMPRLVRLLLHSNRIRELPRGLPPMLTHLQLQDNAVEELPELAFESNGRLHELSIAGNAIRAIHRAALRNLTQLRKLHLQGNLVAFFANDLFADLGRLRALDLSNNPLEQLEYGCFDHLISIDSLKLSNLPLSHQISGPLISRAQSLRILDVDGSPALARALIAYDLRQYGLRSIQYLNMMRTNITFLEATFPQFLPQLQTLLLSDNPWHCDRALHWLQGWLQKGEVADVNGSQRSQEIGGTVILPHRDHIRCATPRELAGRSVGDVRASEWTLNERKWGSDMASLFRLRGSHG